MTSVINRSENAECNDKRPFLRISRPIARAAVSGVAAHSNRQSQSPLNAPLQPTTVTSHCRAEWSRPTLQAKPSFLNYHHKNMGFPRWSSGRSRRMRAPRTSSSLKQPSRPRWTTLP
jgi:hypothetical protein